MSNPYELRFKVLEMARELEMHQYEQLMNSYWSLYSQFENMLVQIDGKIGTEFDSAYEKLYDLSCQLKEAIPPMPTPDQINQKASELYEFVERKPQRL